MEINADPLRQSPSDAGLRITVKLAIEAFLQDEEVPSACEDYNFPEQDIV